MTSRLKALLVLGAGIFVVGGLMNRNAPEAPKPATQSPQRQTATAAARPAAPFLKVTIDQLDYDTNGYMKVLGRAENTGAASAFSPTMKLRVTDATGKTILVDTSAWPAGQYLKQMAPGTAAAFEFFTRVPGDPSNIRWRVSVDEYEHSVTGPK